MKVSEWATSPWQDIYESLLEIKRTGQLQTPTPDLGSLRAKWRKANWSICPYWTTWTATPIYSCYGLLTWLIENVPPAVHQYMWYMYDGAPAHFTRPVRQFLDDTYQFLEWTLGLVTWQTQSLISTPQIIVCEELKNSCMQRPCSRY